MNASEKLMNNMKDLLLNMINNKEDMLVKTLKDLDEMEKIITGVPKVINSIETGSEENLRHQLKNQMASLLKVSNMLKRQALINTIILSSSDFETSAAKLANKFGGGSEALRTLFKNIMKGV